MYLYLFFLNYLKYYVDLYLLNSEYLFVVLVLIKPELLTMSDLLLFIFPKLDETSDISL